MRRHPTRALLSLTQDEALARRLFWRAHRGNAMKRASSGVRDVAVAASIAVLVFAAGQAQAQGEGTVAPRPRPAHPALFAPASAVAIKPTTAQQRDERRFLKDAAAAGRFESEAARLALGKSNNAGVRSFAATLINHHTSAGNELQYMLHVRGMAAPMLANDQRKTLNRLAKLQGAKFDREFMEELGLKNQQDNVHMFEKASLATRDPQLKAWIDRTLPTLRYHLTTVERLMPDARMARTGAAAQAAPAIRHAAAPAATPPAVQSLTADPFVSRASLATRSMGAGPMPLGLTVPQARKPSEANTR
jgi:predicted outer membrane protein